MIFQFDKSYIIPPGTARLVFGVTDANRVMINKAAKKLKLSQGQFLRSAIVQFARQIIEEPKHDNPTIT